MLKEWVNLLRDCTGCDTRIFLEILRSSDLVCARIVRNSFRYMRNEMLE